MLLSSSTESDGRRTSNPQCMVLRVIQRYNNFHQHSPFLTLHDSKTKRLNSMLPARLALVADRPTRHASIVISYRQLIMDNSDHAHLHRYQYLVCSMPMCTTLCGRSQSCAWPSQVPLSHNFAPYNGIYWSLVTTQERCGPANLVGRPHSLATME